MANNFKNSKSDIIFSSLAAAALLERAIRGIFFAEASSFVRGNRTPRLFAGESATMMGLLYLGLSLVFIGYLLRFNRWKSLLYLGLFVSWLIASVVILWI
jgi:hypothetical protein